MSIVSNKYTGKAALLALITITGMGLSGQVLASTDKHKITLALESGDRTSASGQSVQMLAELVKKNSNGRIDINIFYQGELGGQQEMFDQLVRGNIDMMLTWPQTSYDERLAVNYIPYLTLGWEDALKAYSEDGWLKNILAEVYDDMHLHYFGPYPEGFGGIATKGKYATNFEAAQGINVRSQPVFPLPQTMTAMGFQATPVDWSEVYTAIQTGVVDGDSSNVIYYDYEYFRDQIQYYVHSKHNFSSYALLMSGDTWEKLDKEDQDIISKAAEQVIEKKFGDARAEDEKWIAAAKAAGIQYIEPTPAEMQAWVKRVREQVWPEAEKMLGKGLMDKLRANASNPE